MLLAILRNFSRFRGEQTRSTATWSRGRSPQLIFRLRPPTLPPSLSSRRAPPPRVYQPPVHHARDRAGLLRAEGRWRAGHRAVTTPRHGGAAAASGGGGGAARRGLEMGERERVG